jgi:soluble lytic murein transglycosylase
MKRVDRKTAAVAAARIALDGGLRHARRALAKVRHSDDPGLLYDWSQALRLAHKDDSAHAMLLRVTAAPLVRDHAARWWNEVAIQARDALAAGSPHMAFRLVAHAGLASGADYAEQQFLGGFIALRMLKEPATALVWFRRLDAAVTRPISKARAHYWQGRAYEQKGDTAEAIAQYRLAATWPETFYGQIALARLDPAPLLHLTAMPVEAAPPVELDGDLLMPQIKILADLDQETSLRLFVDRDVQANTSPGHAKRLMLSLTEWGYPEIALRLAKAQSYEGISFPDLLFPVIALPAWRGDGGGPEPALVLGLIRQETEFNPDAVSSSGARGIIQLMPGTAKAAARIAGLPYRPSALLSDPAYAIQLGMTTFNGNLDRFDGSKVLAIASYNAGSANAKKWIAVNGDPRAGGVDPIDWIERIPFGETRNYVERVLENAQVYRGRLAGRDVPLRIMADLYGPGGAPPPPVLRAGGN